MEPILSHVRLNIHGVHVELSCELDWLSPTVHRLLAGFIVEPDAEAPGSGGMLPIRLEINRYDPEQVLRQVNNRATRLRGHREAGDLYQDQERFWMVDDRWGMSHVNLLKGLGSSWVIDQPRTDAISTVEAAVLWPLAQLATSRQMHLVPAISIVRDGFGLLILSGMDLEMELRTLVQAGYRIVGQRWTAVRRINGQITLGHMPGPMQQSRITGGRPMEPMRLLQRSWIDLLGEYMGASRQMAPCNAVVITHPGRRSMAFVEPLDRMEAMGHLRAAWPMTELSVTGQPGTFFSALARQAAAYRLQLTHEPLEMLEMLADLRDRDTKTAIRSSIHTGPASNPLPMGQSAASGKSTWARMAEKASQAARLQEAAERLRQMQHQSNRTPRRPAPVARVSGQDLSPGESVVHSLQQVMREARENLSQGQNPQGQDSPVPKRVQGATGQGVTGERSSAQNLQGPLPPAAKSPHRRAG